jgi:peptidoglycan/xylan/chitin deacetylase (PgdA/CDA1 family)
LKSIQTAVPGSARGGDRELLAPGEIVLTFDDGPAPLSTRPILAALAAQCTKATFFMVGEMAVEHADVVREVAEQGHTLGTHTWSHLQSKTAGRREDEGADRSSVHGR